MRVQRHVWHAVTFLPLLSAPAPALLPSPLLPATPARLQCVVWSAAFVFKRASRKQIICTQPPLPVPPPLLPLPPLLTHNKLTAIKRFCQHAAGMGQNLRADGDGGGGVARCSSCLHRPENYSAHKLLNAKSFDFNYVEHFYCPRRGLRMRKRRTFAQLLRLPGCVCFSYFSFVFWPPLSPPLSFCFALCMWVFSGFS